MKIMIRIPAFLLALLLLTGRFCSSHPANFVIPLYAPIQKLDHLAKPPIAKRNLLVWGYCRSYRIPHDLCLTISCIIYDNPLQYRNKLLPHDLSDKDLSGFDFTGCHFTYTNLTDSNLTGVILEGTTCDYEKTFQENRKKNQLQGGNWYQENIPKDLKSIAKVYPKLSKNSHKGALLQIACGLSRLPFYESTEFYIQVEYWSYIFLQLKQLLGNLYGQELVCSLKDKIDKNANGYCWVSHYPQNKVTINCMGLHANFNNYLNDFTNGVKQYHCQSIYAWGFTWYKTQITHCINGLGKAYPYIKSKYLQQTASDIAHTLSKSYEVSNKVFLYHYLFSQYQLIRLKQSVSIAAQSKVHYNNGLAVIWVNEVGWSRGKK